MLSDIIFALVMAIGGMTLFALYNCAVGLYAAWLVEKNDES